MHSGDSSRISRAEKARLHRQRVEAITRRQRQRQRSVAVQRRAIPGADHLSAILAEIAAAQAALIEAGENLRTLLSIGPLRKAYGDFQNQGGITAADWAAWLGGKTLGKACHASSKGHLRLVSVRHAPLPRPSGTLADDLVETEADDRTDSGDGPEAA